MCTLTGITRRKIGYKVVAIKDGKFYSTFTGQELKVGAVPKAPDTGKRLSGSWSYKAEGNLKFADFYDSNYDGFTAAFVDKSDAKYLSKRILSYLIYDTYSIVIVKITFKGLANKGRYDADDIIAGKFIKSMKIIKS